MIIKKIFFIPFLFSFIFLYGQDDPIEPTVEYATVYLKVFYQGNIIHYDENGVSKAPLLSMPGIKTQILKDYTDVENPKKFLRLNDILNYMTKYGWVFKSSNVLSYSGGSGNNSKSIILNTNEFIQIIVFERPVK